MIGSILCEVYAGEVVAICLALIGLALLYDAIRERWRAGKGIGGVR